jgi:raffinose/stachyose/melibiose transport system substrate-binding protein
LSAGALLVACAPAQTSAPASDAQAGAGEGAAAGSAERTQVLVWDQFGAQSAGVDEMVAMFNEAHPDIEVTREAQQNMRDILKTALDAGTGPDVMYYDTGPGFAGVLARAGLLLPLDDAYAEYGWNDRILPIAKDRATLMARPMASATKWSASAHFTTSACLKR